ncbi:FMN-binding protein, partial [uncultured Parasutterella sp.]
YSRVVPRNRFKNQGKVGNNTPDVADVGGATESSHGIKQAVKDALSKAQ